MTTHATTEEGKSLDLSEYRTIKGLVEEHRELFSEFQIRWALRNREDNGLKDAVVRFGRTLYIHVPTFTKIFSRQR